MSLSLLDQIARLQQEFRHVRMTLETLQLRVDELMTSLREQTKAEGRPTLFTDSEGIWKDADISLEDIKTAEYRLPANLP